MKSKTFDKKLKLNKETIFNLNVTEMNEVHGGARATPWPYWCETDEAGCTNYCPNTYRICGD